MRWFNPGREAKRKKLNKMFGFKAMIKKSRKKSKKSKEERDNDKGIVTYIDGIKHIEITSRKRLT